LKTRKDLIRRDVIKLKILKNKSYSEIKDILTTNHHYPVTVRTLKRWCKRQREDPTWDLMDKSRRPKTIHNKITPEIEKEVIELRKATGYGSFAMKEVLKRFGIQISESSIKRINRKHGLSRGSKMKGKKLKWIRWQRKHPNSLWQVDHAENNDKTWDISVIDDCSRYFLALKTVDSVTTEAITTLLDELIDYHSKPREILTDNGSVYGGNGTQDNEFDKWCDKKGIKHIRSRINKPTTTGKVEKSFDTRKRELEICNNDRERFRYRYNHWRPHMSLHGKTPAEVYFDIGLLFEDEDA